MLCFRGMIPLPVGQWESENRNLTFAVGSVFGKPSLVKTPTKLPLKKTLAAHITELQPFIWEMAGKTL